MTAVQVAFWNAGGEPIRPEHVLEPFVLRLGSSAQLIEATLRKSNRRAVKITISPSSPKRTTSSPPSASGVAVSWNILEEDDGAVIQLLFAGDSEAHVTAEGVVVGQRTIAPPSRLPAFFSSVVVGLASALFSSLGSNYFLVRRDGLQFRRRDLLVPFLAGAVGAVILATCAVMFFHRPSPPFGF